MLAILFRIDPMTEKSIVPVVKTSLVATLAIFAWHYLGELPYIATGGESPNQIQQTIRDLIFTSR